MHDKITFDDRIDSAPSSTSMKARWINWRNGVLANPAFQAWASRFPLTRGVARTSARRLFDVIAGFTYSQTLFAALQCGLIDRLQKAPAGLAELSSHCGLAPAAMERLLLAAAALDLVESLDGGWALGQQGAALAGNPGAQAMIRHHHLLYADLADPLGLLRGERKGAGALAGYWPYALGDGSEGRDSTAVTSYSDLMAASQPMVADQVVNAFDFRHHQSLLDVGGGAGAFVSAVAATAPGLNVAVFDLPAVAQIAQQRLAAQGLNAKTYGGDFRTDPIPDGHDLISLVRILHDHDDALVMTLLRKVHAALPAGGTLLIAEPMAGTKGAEAIADAYFGFYLLAMGTGKARTAKAIGAMALAAGFDEWREIPTALPIITRLIRVTRKV